MVLTSYELRSKDKIPNTRTYVFFLSSLTKQKHVSSLRVWRLGYAAVTIACGVACNGGRLDSEKLSAVWRLTTHKEARVW